MGFRAVWDDKKFLYTAKSRIYFPEVTGGESAGSDHWTGFRGAGAP